MLINLPRFIPAAEHSEWVHAIADKLEQLRTARVITAIKTPYKAGGKFDLEAFDRLVQLQIEHGTDGLIIGGTTGEGQLMKWEEHIMLIAHTCHTYGKDLLVIGNTGTATSWGKRVLPTAWANGRLRALTFIMME